MPHDDPPQPDEASAGNARDPRTYELVIIVARDFRLPEVLRHIEAGRSVLVIPSTQHPPLAA